MCSQLRQKAGPQNARRVARAAPGASVFSASPTGVSANRCPVALGEHSEAGQRTHQAVQGGRVRLRRSRQFLCAPRTCGQMIGETEFGGRVNRRGDPRGRGHLDQLNVRR